MLPAGHDTSRIVELHVSREQEMFNNQHLNEHCAGCVCQSPNLWEDVYPAKDCRVLQGKRCSFYFQAEDGNCSITHKTGGSLVDSKALKQSG